MGWTDIGVGGGSFSLIVTRSGETGGSGPLGLHYSAALAPSNRLSQSHCQRSPVHILPQLCSAASALDIIKYRQKSHSLKSHLGQVKGNIEPNKRHTIAKQPVSLTTRQSRRVAEKKTVDISVIPFSIEYEVFEPPSEGRAF